MVKTELEKLYTGVMSVFEYAEVTDEKTGVSSFYEVLTYEKIPCRISFEKGDSMVQGRVSGYITQKIKLFYPTEVEIRPGSKIEVIQNGKVFLYRKSGEAFVYKNHCEAYLELLRENA